MKRWLIGIAVLVLAATLLLPQLAADIDFFFAKATDKLTMNPLEGWAAVLAGGKPLGFYLILTVLVALLLTVVLFTGTYLNYRSDMQVVTPDIVTPCATGQGQFGTARWLPQEEVGRHFGIWRISGRSKDLQALLEAGKTDGKKIRNAKI